MLNGKFFTGLPPRMCENRSNRPDRLKSNLYWPDETEHKSATSDKKLNFRNNHEILNDAEEINPKNLYHKQLASKITFDDTLDTSLHAQEFQSPKYGSSMNNEKLNNNRSDICDNVKTFNGTKRNELQQNHPQKVFTDEGQMSTQKSLDNPLETYKINNVKEMIVEVEENAEANALIGKNKNIPNRNISRSVENIPKMDRDIGSNKIYNHHIPNRFKNVNMKMALDHMDEVDDKMYNRLCANETIDNNVNDYYEHLNYIDTNSIPYKHDRNIDLDQRCTKPTQFVQNKNQIINISEKSVDYNNLIKHHQNDMEDQNKPQQFTHQQSTQHTYVSTISNHPQKKQQQQQQQQYHHPHQNHDQHLTKQFSTNNHNTSEARARVHNNLKSNIFFNDC